MSEGFVYLIENVYDGMYKIGFTENTVEERLKQLQTASSQKLEIVSHVKCRNHKKIEKYLHRIFAHRHRIGEWFALEPDDIKKFVAICEMMEKNYNYLLESKEIFEG